MGIMKRLGGKSKLTKDEKSFIKRSQEDVKHFPIKIDKNEKK